MNTPRSLTRNRLTPSCCKSDEQEPVPFATREKIVEPNQVEQQCP